MGCLCGKTVELISLPRDSQRAHNLGNQADENNNQVVNSAVNNTRNNNLANNSGNNTNTQSRNIRVTQAIDQARRVNQQRANLLIRLCNNEQSSHR